VNHSLSLLCLVGLFATPEAGATARARGDRLAVAGKLEAALEAYAAAYSAAERDTLAAYNAGTLALQLGRLPEAVLWLRRAQAGAAEPDPWAAENLAAARRLLGLPDRPVARPWSLAERAAPWLGWGAAALAWGGLGLGLATRRTRGGLAVLAASALLFVAGQALSRWGPREAVLLRACPGLSLSPGSEIWVFPGAESVRVLGPGGSSRCPAGSLGLVSEP
jgi:tetratricopeptide (TPR) repeat protein